MEVGTRIVSRASQNTSTVVEGLMWIHHWVNTSLWWTAFVATEGKLSDVIINAKDAHRLSVDSVTVLHLLHTLLSSKGILLSIGNLMFYLPWVVSGIVASLRQRNISNRISNGRLQMGLKVKFASLYTIQEHPKALQCPHHSVQIHVRYVDNIVTLCHLRHPSRCPADCTLYVIQTSPPDNIQSRNNMCPLIQHIILHSDAVRSGGLSFYKHG